MFSLASFSQESVPVNNEKGFYFGINVSGDYCYRDLVINESNSITEITVDSRNKNEIPRISYTGGLNVGYQISKNVGIETGIQYSEKGYARELEDLVYGDMIDPRLGFIYPESSTSPIENIRINYRFNYLDIPLKAVFKLGNRKLRFIGSIGVVTNVFLNEKRTIRYEYEDGRTSRKVSSTPNEYNSVNVSPTLSIGVDYKLSEKFNLRLEPTYRYGLMQIIDAPISAHLWSAGLNFSCYYSFNKCSHK